MLQCEDSCIATITGLKATLQLISVQKLLHFVIKTNFKNCFSYFFLVVLIGSLSWPALWSTFLTHVMHFCLFAWLMIC